MQAVMLKRVHTGIRSATCMFVSNQWIHNTTAITFHSHISLFAYANIEHAFVTLHLGGTLIIAMAYSNSFATRRISTYLESTYVCANNLTMMLLHVCYNSCFLYASFYDIATHNQYDVLCS